MKITIAALGKMRSGSPEQHLMQDYLKRLPWQVTVKEMEEKRKLSGDALKDAEGKLLLGAIPAGAKIIALDERGKQFSSREFAGKLEQISIEGAPLAFLIGGADGHSKEIKSQANLLWSLGSLTYPHMLARVLLAEQLYRAWSILNRHPYHRD